MNKTTRIIYALTVLYVIFVLVIFPRWTVDDAYISFRYASNLANHGELTWNVGEDPIEGYTGVVLPVILAIFIKNGFEPSIVSHVLGILSLLGCGVVLLFFLSRLSITGILRAVIIFIFFTSPFLYINAFSGLETLLFSLAGISSLYVLYLLLEANSPSNSQDILFLLLLLVTGLIRPEGVILAGLSILAVSYKRFTEQKNAGWSFIWKMGLFYFLPALIYFLWRWDYYGLFFPNTYYAKLSEHWIALRTIKDSVKFFLNYLLIPSLAVSVLLWSCYGRDWKALAENLKNHLTRPKVITSTVALAYLLVIFMKYLQTELLMNFSYRFFLPFYPILLILVGILIHTGLKKQTVLNDPKRVRFAGPILLLLIIIYPVLNYSQLTSEIKTVTSYRQLLADEHIPVAEFLKENIPPEEWLSVYIDAGVIPYFAGLKTIDFGRLNDENLAGRNFSGKEIADYFFSHNPAAAVFTSCVWDSIYNTPWAYDITRDERFQNYILVNKYRSDAVNKYYEFLYVRNDLVPPDELVKSTPPEGL